MNKGKIIDSDDEIRDILRSSKTVAVLGMSPKPERDSYKVGNYLKNKEFRIIPVRPAQKNIIGAKAVASLDHITEPVDIVDAFRASDRITGHVDEIIRLRPKVFWMQLGIENQKAAEKLTSEGIDVVMNKCIKVEYERLVG